MDRAVWRVVLQLAGSGCKLADMQLQHLVGDLSQHGKQLAIEDSLKVKQEECSSSAEGSKGGLGVSSHGRGLGRGGEGGEEQQGRIEETGMQVQVEVEKEKGGGIGMKVSTARTCVGFP